MQGWKMRWVNGSLLGLGLLLGGVGDLAAQTKVGIICADSQGKIVVRAKCRSNETTLSLGALSSAAPTGDSGAPGAMGASGYQIVSTTWASQTIPPAGRVFDTVCPAGKTTVGGGCYSQNSIIFNYESRPFDSTPRAWRCGFSARSESQSATSVELRTYAICVNE